MRGRGRPARTSRSGACRRSAPGSPPIRKPEQGDRHAGAEGAGEAGRPDARSAQWWIAADIDDPRPGAQREITRFEWVADLQHVLHAQRNDGSRGSLDTVGIKLNRQLADNVYLTAQAHSAYAGGAGAYSIGLVGAGLSTTPSAHPWQLGAEVLAGAAGGGGVDTRGGAIVQTLAWAGWPVAKDGQLRLGLGGVRAVRGGGLSSPLIEVSWSQAFGLSGR